LGILPEKRSDKYAPAIVSLDRQSLLPRSPNVVSAAAASHALGICRARTSAGTTEKKGIDQGCFGKNTESGGFWP